jgi:hypothetical protein
VYLHSIHHFQENSKYKLSNSCLSFLIMLYFHKRSDQNANHLY